MTDRGPGGALAGSVASTGGFFVDSLRLLLLALAVLLPWATVAGLLLLAWRQWRPWRRRSGKPREPRTAPIVDAPEVP